jgi:hypothetical protein
VTLDWQLKVLWEWHHEAAIEDIAKQLGREVEPMGQIEALVGKDCRLGSDLRFHLYIQVGPLLRAHKLGLRLIMLCVAGSGLALAPSCDPRPKPQSQTKSNHVAIDLRRANQCFVYQHHSSPKRCKIA